MFPGRFSFYLFLSITVSVVAADQLGFADARIERGKEYLDTGRLQEAEALLAKIIESDPNNSEAHHLLGLSYLQEGRFREAERHLDRAAQLNPTSAEALKDLGEVYVRVHKRERAIKTLARSLFLKPAQPTTQYSLGMLFLEAGDTRQAAAHLGLARRYGLRHSGVLLNLGRAYLNLTRVEKALEVLDELLRASPRHAPLHLQVGKMLFENLLYEDAAPPLARAWELAPDSYEAGFYWALNNYLLAKPEESLKVLEELRAKGTQSSEVDNFLGAVYAKLGRTDEAIALFTKNIELRPDQPDAYFNWGLILLEQGDRSQAKKLLERAGTLYRGDAKIFYIIGAQQACSAVRQGLDQTRVGTPKEDSSADQANFYLELGKVFQNKFQFGSAAELLRIAWELNPDNFEILLRLGVCCYNLDDLSNALAMFRRAASLRPDSDKIHYFLGNCYTSMVNAPEALRAYQRAIQLAPNNAVYYYRLGNVFYRERQMEEALAAYKAALSLSPDEAATHSALGRAYQRLKREDLAVSEFREAIRLNPALPQPYYYLAQYHARKGHADEAEKFSTAFQRKTAIVKRTPGRFAHIRVEE